MGHADGLDHESLAREVLAGADAWQSGDRPAATNRLRAAFELLTQARERFYPVDAYLVDLCLLDPSMPAGALAEPLEARVAGHLPRPGPGHREPGRARPRARSPRSARRSPRAGPTSRAGRTPRPTSRSCPSSRSSGSSAGAREVYREHLDDRNVETLRPAAVRPLPAAPPDRQAVRVPVRRPPGLRRRPVPDPPRGEAALGEPRRHEPGDADPPAAGRRPPGAGAARSPGGWRATMKDDHVATLAAGPLAEPGRRLVSSTSGGSPRTRPVLARWVTLNDYFHLTDRPYETFRPEPDAVRHPLPGPGRRAAATRGRSRGGPSHARLRARLDALAPSAHSRGPCSAPSRPARRTDDPTDAAAGRLETGRSRPAGSTRPRPLERHETALGRRRLAGRSSGHGHGRAGPATSCSTRWASPGARPCSCPTPRSTSAPRARSAPPSSPTKGSGPWSTCRRSASPGCPARPTSTRPRAAAGAALGPRPGRSRTSRSRSRSTRPRAGSVACMAAGEETARLGQQLVVAGLAAPDGKPVASRGCGASRSRSSTAAPPWSRRSRAASIVDPRDDRRLATFRQRYRLWTRPADPGDRRHARATSTPTGWRASPRPTLGPLPGLPLGLARPDLDAPADRACSPPS